MENWQREHIRVNLYELVKLTNCTRPLLDKLHAKGVLTDEEIDQLDSPGNPKYRKSSELYSILFTRTNGYNILAQVLHSESQSGAHAILQNGVIQHGEPSPATPSLLDSSTVLFAETLPAIVDFLDGDELILIVSTPSRKLSLKRMVDTGLDFLTIHKAKSAPIKPALRKLGEGYALVVDCDRVQPMLEKILGSTKQVVLVTEAKGDEIEKIVESLSPVPTIAYESFHWTDLTIEAQERILEGNVMFQNKIVRLEEFFAAPRTPMQDNTKCELHNVSLEISELTSNLLVDLMSGDCPELVKLSVPPTPPYYIPRQIGTRANLSSDILNIPGNDVFVIKGIEMNQLASLQLEAIESTTQKEKITSRFIQLVIESDFEKICAISEAPVHLLLYCQEGHFTWIRSKGSIALIQKNVLLEHHGMDEDKFIRFCASAEIPICIADSPGMGKSVLLARIAESVLEENPTCPVSFIVLQEFIREFAVNNISININSVCDAIAQASSDLQVGRKLVANSLQSEDIKCHLFLDGYDEVLKEQTGIADEIIRTLKKLRNTQLYVTTRLHMETALERKLGALGFRTEPFRVQEQLDFLIGFWQSEGAPKNERLEKFATACLGNLRSNMTDFERDIAGIPLQCKLMSQVYCQQSIEYSSTTEDSLLPLPSLSSIFKVYESYINMGFDKVEAISIDSKISLLDEHMYYAIELLYPHEEILHELRQLLPISPRHTLLLYTPGILEKGGKDAVPRFVHRTLAEFLVAKFVVECGGERRGKVDEELVAKLLFSMVLSTSEQFDFPFHGLDLKDLSVGACYFEHPVVCYFLASLFTSSEMEHFVSIVSEATSESVEVFSYIPKFTSMYVASIVMSSQNLANFLCKLLNQYNHINMQWADVLLLAAKYCSEEHISQLCKLLYRYCEKSACDFKYPTWSTCTFTSVSIQLAVTPLHISVWKGDFHATKYLLSHGGFHSLLVDGSKQTKWLIHVCVYKSCGQTNQTILSKIEILKFLHNWSLLEDAMKEKLPNGATPLLQSNVHVDLIQCLIQLGADVNALTEDEECVLHTAVKGGRSSVVSPVRYHSLVEELANLGFRHFRKTNLRDQTPLHCAAAAVDLQPQTIILFLENAAEINQADSDEDSVLFSAVRGSSSGEFIRALIDRGADHTYRNKAGYTALHVAIQHENFGAVQYFLNDTPDLLQVTDEQGNTALHAAVMLRYSSDLIRIQMALINAGADINALSKEGCNPFMHCVKYVRGANLRTIKLFEERGGFQLLPDNASDALYHLMTNTILALWEWDEEIVRVAEHLMEKGAILQGENEQPPWCIEPVLASMDKMIEVTELSRPLLEKLRRLGVKNTCIIRDDPNSDSQGLYNMLKSTPGSYERLMLALICSNQTVAFILLRQCIQTDNNNFALFWTLPSEVSEFMRLDQQKADILVIYTESRDIVIRRIRDTLNYKVEDLGEELTHSESAVRFVSCPSVEKVAALWTPGQRIVCIIQGQNQALRDLSNESESMPSIEIARDVFAWEDLTSVFQDKIRQGIAGRLPQSETLLQRVVEEAAHHSKRTLLNKIAVSTRITNPFAIYLKNLVSVSIFDHYLGDVLVFEGLKLKELKSLMKCNQTFTRSSKRVMSDYILLENNKDFKWICEHSENKAVHLVSVFNGVFRLVKSSGSTSRLRRFLMNNESDPVSLGDFLNISRACRLIRVPLKFSYSTFLESLQDANRNHLFYYITLDDLVLILDKYFIAKDRKYDNIMYAIFTGLLLESCGMSDDQTSMNNNKLVLIIQVYQDVVDTKCELSLKMAKVRSLVNLISQECVGIEVIIFTNGESATQNVESEFDIIRHELENFTLEYFVSSMSASCIHHDEDVQKLKSFAHSFRIEFINQVGYTLPIHSISHCVNTWMSSPAENLVFFAFLLSRGYLSNDPDSHQFLMGIKSVSTLFKLFVELRLKDEANQFIRENLMIQIASLFYSKWVNVSSNLKQEQLDILLTFLDIRKSNKWYTNVVSEFANYFMAQILVDSKLSKIINNPLEFITQVLFLIEQLSEQNFIFKNPGLCHFVDSILNLEETEYFLGILKQAVPECPNQFGLVLACVTANCSTLRKLILESVDNSDKLINSDLIKLPITIADKETTAFICEVYSRMQPENLLHTTIRNDDKKPLTLLKLSVRIGDFLTARFLVDSAGFGKNKDGNCLLHTCVWKSNSDAESVILQKLKIIKMLVSREHNLLNERDHNGRTATLTVGASVELLNLLISLGADVSLSDNDGRTILHMAALHFTPAQYHELVNHLASRRRAECFKNEKYATVPHYAVKYLEVLPETIHLFHLLGFNFNTRCVVSELDPQELDFMHACNRGDRETVLCVAVKENRSAVVISALIQHGADFRKRFAYDQSFLHGAAKFRSLNAVMVLVQNGISINQVDKYGRTPLHYVFFEDSTQNMLETVRLLVECGADINARDSLENAILDFACPFAAIFQYLISQGAVIRDKNKFAKNIRHLEFPRRHISNP